MLKRPEKKLAPFSNSRCASALPCALAPAVKSRSLQAKGRDGPEDAWHRVAHAGWCWCLSGSLAPIYWGHRIIVLPIDSKPHFGRKRQTEVKVTWPTPRALERLASLLCEFLKQARSQASQLKLEVGNACVKEIGSENQGWHLKVMVKQGSFVAKNR